MTVVKGELLKHYRVQCYTQVKSLKCYLATRRGFCATNVLEVESLIELRVANFYPTHPFLDLVSGWS